MLAEAAQQTESAASAALQKEIAEKEALKREREAQHKQQRRDEKHKFAVVRGGDPFSSLVQRPAPAS